MISIGSFVFPHDRTFYEVKMIEAKSKVRKEIHITSLLDGCGETSLQDQIARLQSSVEAYDRRQARLSLHGGRYYEGRRRVLEVLPDVQHQLAFVKLISLTSDRFERSNAIHMIDSEIFFGYLSQSIWNAGNWQTSPRIEIIPDVDVTNISIKNGDCEFLLNHDIPANTPITINTNDRNVIVGTNNIHVSSDARFPVLHAEQNSLEFQLTPTTANATVKIQCQDVWV